MEITNGPFFTTSTGLIDSIDKKLMVVLRDGRKLIELDISRNNLTMLPKEMFTYLNQIQVFNAASNQLKEISTEFYNLKQLKVLNLSQNQIAHIPAELPKKTPNLITLRISGNQISQLPSTIRYWTHLKHLHLGSVYGGNQLKELPPTIARMQTLEDLDLSNNQLRLLPDNFFLFSLISLNLSHNQLDYIPKSIARCTRLKSLNLSKNHLTCLPSDLMNLHQLELLDINSRVLELGTGTGMVGLVCDLLGAQQVHVTDYHPRVLENVAYNIQLNQSRATFSKLDFIEVANDQGKQETYDIVIASDLLYEMEHAKYLPIAVNKLVKNEFYFMIPLRDTHWEEVECFQATMNSMPDLTLITTEDFKIDEELEGVVCYRYYHYARSHMIQ
ncbi:hypothetical protein RMATCC62417_14630 [Rhizopus microsporus]|nr:hypothetical protein RMATCC62417_14630 [Rhizopus microsporus]